MTGSAEETNRAVIPMVRINGAEVRLLREERGLTQLYLATAVGVTTETISRWERGRSPNIKKENGIRLAEALEVELAEILEQPPESDDEPVRQEAAEDKADVGSPSTGSVFRLTRNSLIVLSAVTLALSMLSLSRWVMKENKPVIFSASRLIPVHSAEGKPFPVIIDVALDGMEKSSLLVTEKIAEQCKMTWSLPKPGQSSNNTLKWIVKDGGDHGVFAYMVTCSDPGSADTVDGFSGTIVARRGGQARAEITGVDRISLMPFHWA
ncbi:MAG: helix-turn-helix transcriptional regulator, partial [Thermodesulfobacteriota bacterium]